MSSSHNFGDVFTYPQIKPAEWRVEERFNPDPEDEKSADYADYTDSRGQS